MRDALAEHRGRGVLIEDEIEAARGGARGSNADCRRPPRTADAVLRGRRLDHDVVEMPEAAVVREALARDPGARHHLERFLEAGFGFLRRDLEALELVVPIALADAEIEPAAGNQIERRRLLGEQHRIVPGQHDDGGAEPQRGCAHRRAPVSSINVAETWFQPLK